MSVPTIRQRHAPILVERAGSNLNSWRRVTTNPLSFVDTAHHVGDHSWLETGVDEVFEAGGMLDVALDEIVKHFVGWQVLWESGLRTALHVDDAPRTHLGDAVTVAGKVVQQGLRTVLERRESSDEVSEQVGDPHGDVSLVAGGEHEVSAFVEDVAERDRAGAGVAALPAHVGILFGQGFCVIGYVSFGGGHLDGDGIEGDAEVARKLLGVGARFVWGFGSRHGYGQHALWSERVGGNHSCDGAVDASG